MTANLLTLNSSKTEFLLIGLRKQLAKIHNSSLNTAHSARNFGFIFDEHLTFSDQISSVSKFCYYHGRNDGEQKTKKRICSEVSVNNPGNPCSKFGRRKGRLCGKDLQKKKVLSLE